MSDKKYQQVSSLVDGFQASEADVDALLSDNEKSDIWQRYHLIGDVMRDDVHSIDQNLSASIADAIRQEPTVLAPTKSAFVQAVKAKVFQFAKPFGQIAIAASAAGLMILGVQQNNVSDSQPLVPAQVVQTNPLAGIAAPVSFNYQQETPSPEVKPDLGEQSRHFQALLNDHQQQVKLNGGDKKTTQAEASSQ